MSAKIDLDELERKALACKSGFWISLALDASDDERWADPESQASAVHIAANGPLVTLALVARIRELEGACRRIAGESDWCPVCEQNPSTGHHRDCALEKGAVLP